MALDVFVKSDDGCVRRPVQRANGNGMGQKGVRPGGIQIYIYLCAYYLLVYPPGIFYEKIE